MANVFGKMVTGIKGAIEEAKKRRDMKLYQMQQRVLSKIENEYECFISDLKQMSIDDILERSYEKTYKEEIVKMFKSKCPTDDEDYLVAILESPNALEEMYEWYTLAEISHRDMLWETIEEKLDKIVLEDGGYYEDITYKEEFQY